MKQLEELSLELVIPECITCNLYEKVRVNKRCKSCSFKCGSDGAATGKNFLDYNIKIDLPKSHYFYFIYHKELNWKFPVLPDLDLYNKSKSTHKKWNWIIHHEDLNHSNDSKWNLILLINTEHHYIHILNKNPMDNLNYDFSKTIRCKYKERYKKGLNLDLNKNKYYATIDKLNSLLDGIYQINKSFCIDFGYTSPYNLWYSINSIIKNNEISNITLLNNGKENSAKRWFLKKLKK
jgi:hypothetical protein